MELHADIQHAETLWTGTPSTSTLLSGKLVVSALIETVTYVDNLKILGIGMVPQYLLVKIDTRTKERNTYLDSWCILGQGPPPLDTAIWCLCILVDPRQKWFERCDLGNGY
jgi:hypothetical protein